MTRTTTSALVKKYEIYKGLSLGHPARDSYGMFRPDDSVGDSILFSCLHQFATGEQIDFMGSFSEEGLPIRHPEVGPADTASPISRDMIVGFMLCALSSPDKGAELMSKLTHAGVDNNWDLCGSAPEYEISIKVRLGRCIMTPGLISTMYRVSQSLGNSCTVECKLAQQIPSGVSKSPTGFARHLAVLHLLIRGLAKGLSTSEIGILKHHAEAQPNNALYQAAYHKFADGDQSSAVALLLDPTTFPAQRLPSSDNYCTPYLYQRDESARHDWLPCPAEGATHIGIDFLFAGRVAL